MDLTNQNETLHGLCSHRTQAKTPPDTSVCPRMTRKPKCLRSESENNDKICKTINVEVPRQTKEMQPSTPTFFPTVVKIMVHSNIASGFWLHLPNNFCKLHLPKEDVIMTLEDDDGKESNVKYLWAKASFSGGWRGFSIAHKLSEGDKLVFQLVQPLKFKVHIIRLEDSDEADGALNNVMSDSSFKNIQPAKDSRISKRKADKHCGGHEAEIIKNHSQDDGLKSFKHCGDHEVEIIKNHSEDHGLKSCASTIDFARKMDDNPSTNFEHVRSIEDFVIVVIDIVINSAVPEHVRFKYYELCCSQKSYLHIHLFKSLDSLLMSAGITHETVMMLSAGVISAVVDIADAIRASTITTSPANFTIWEQSLKQVEKLGMNVGFLLDRVIQLKGLAEKLKRCWKIESERIKAEENERILKSSILKVKEEINKLNTEAVILNPYGDDLEHTFKEAANAAW